jgi:hypothetical protein
MSPIRTFMKRLRKEPAAMQKPKPVLSAKEKTLRRRQIYISYRLPEIKLEMERLGGERRNQVKPSTIDHAGRKKIAVRRRVFVEERMATLRDEKSRLREESAKFAK